MEIGDDDEGMSAILTLQEDGCLKHNPSVDIVEFTLCFNSEKQHLDFENSDGDKMVFTKITQ